MIKVKYSSVDGYRKVKSFKTLKGARKYAQFMIGKNPDMGSSYAVSNDGIGKIEIGAGAALADLFGDEREGEEAPGFDSPRAPEWTGFDSSEIDITEP